MKMLFFEALKCILLQEKLTEKFLILGCDTV